MKKFFLHFIKLYLFWLLLFAFSRLVFIIYFHEKFSGIGYGEILKTFTKAFPLDLSASCYLFMLPFVAFLLQSFVQVHFYKKFLRGYLFSLLVINAIITVGDLGIYKEWGTKLNLRAVSNLMYPKEAMASAGSSPLLLFLLIVLLQIFFGWRLFRNFFKSVPGKINLRIPVLLQWMLMNVAAIIFTAIAIRGGLQTIPINESAAYFSNKPVLNHAAVNTPWFLIHSFVENRRNLNTNPYIFMNENEAKKIVASLYSAMKDSTTRLLTTDKPNIVFIQIESYTADVVKELGGVPAVSPNISSLIEKGLLFSNIYSSGFRTDQGLVALLGGFPAQPNVSIIKQADKLEKIPSLAKALKERGYHTSYYYGGELNFANMNAYIYVNDFDAITGGDDFPGEQTDNKWGAPDEFVFQKQQKELKEFPQPFFSYLVTLSSHEPFQVPMKTPFSGKKDLPSQFCHAAYYTDHCLGEYFKFAQEQPWYSNTLFILVADHGHRLPKDRLSYEPAHQYIPLLFFGEVIKQEYRGKVIPALGSQTDVVATLLAQLDIPCQEFNWSNDLMNVFRQPFAFYIYDDGFGWISPADTFVFDNNAQRIIFPANRNNTDVDSLSLVKGKAYLQELFSQYLRY